MQSLQLEFSSEGRFSRPILDISFGSYPSGHGQKANSSTNAEQFVSGQPGGLLSSAGPKQLLLVLRFGGLPTHH